MPAIQLKDLYVWELQHLWSASEQMHAVVLAMASKAYDRRLACDLRASAADTERNTARLQQLLSFVGAHEVPPQNPSMAAIADEAAQRTLRAAPESPELVDLEIMAHFLRLSNYSLADYSTAAAYATALGRHNDHAVLQKIMIEIYGTDTLRANLEERAENAAAIAEAVSDS